MGARPWQRRLPAWGALAATLWILAVTGSTGSFAGAQQAGTTLLTVGAGATVVEGRVVVPVVAVVAAGDTVSEFSFVLAFDPGLLALEDADRVVPDPRWLAPGGRLALVDVSSPGVVLLHATTTRPCEGGTVCPLVSVSWRLRGDRPTEIAVDDASLTGTHNGIPGTVPVVVAEAHHLDPRSAGDPLDGGPVSAVAARGDRWPGLETMLTALALIVLVASAVLVRHRVAQRGAAAPPRAAAATGAEPLPALRDDDHDLRLMAAYLRQMEALGISSLTESEPFAHPPVAQGANPSSAGIDARS